jgi:diacylglycerol kinase family enzyme
VGAISLICNPDSGSGEGPSVEERLRSQAAEVERFGLDEVERALERGPDRLVVAGGDGSIGPVAAAAARASVPLAVVASGTANDFARAHRLPDDLDEACELAAGGERTVAVDLGRMGGRPFVNVASLGLAPAAARRAEGAKGALGAFAYAWGALRAGLGAEPVRCRISSGGTVLFDGDAWQATIACSGAFGGGAGVEADPSDGLLDAVAIEAGSRAGLVKMAYGLRAGRIEAHREASSLRARSFVVELPSSEPFNVDGEVVESGDVEFAVEAGAFELMVP